MTLRRRTAMLIRHCIAKRTRRGDDDVSATVSSKKNNRGRTGKPQVPWHVLVSFIVNRVDPLFTLQSRVELLRGLACVDRDLAREVTTLAWKGLAASCGDWIDRKVKRIELSDFELCSDATVRMMMIDVRGREEWNEMLPPQQQQKRQYLLREDIVRTLRAARAKPHMLSVLRVQMMLNSASSESLCIKDACSRFCLRTSDVSHLPRVSKRTRVRLVDVLDVCREKHATMEILELRRARLCRISRKRAETTRARADERNARLEGAFKDIVGSTLRSVVGEIIQTADGFRQGGTFSVGTNPTGVEFISQVLENDVTLRSRFGIDRDRDSWRMFVRSGNNMYEEETVDAFTRWSSDSIDRWRSFLKKGCGMSGEDRRRIAEQQWSSDQWIMKAILHLFYSPAFDES